MLRDAADFVIVDSPPLLPVADTRVLLRLSSVDGVILIGRARVTRRDRIRGASRLLAQSGRARVRAGRDRRQDHRLEQLLPLRLRRTTASEQRSRASRFPAEQVATKPEPALEQTRQIAHLIERARRRRGRGVASPAALVMLRMRTESTPPIAPSSRSICAQ